MENDKNNELKSNNSSNNSNTNADENETLNVQNPLDKNDNKKVTQEDVENEQLFKEAQTERD